MQRPVGFVPALVEKISYTVIRPPLEFVPGNGLINSHRCTDLLLVEFRHLGKRPGAHRGGA